MYKYRKGGERMIKIGGIYNLPTSSTAYVAIEQFDDITFLLHVCEFQNIVKTEDVLSQMKLLIKHFDNEIDKNLFGYQDHLEKYTDGYLGQIKDTDLLQKSMEYLHDSYVYKIMTKLRSESLC